MKPDTKTDEAKRLAATLRERAAHSQDYVKILNGTVGTVKPLKSIVGENSAEANAKDSKLIAAGIALIAFPDPTITDAIGTGMVAAGLIRRKMRRVTAADAQDELQRIAKEIANLKKEIILSR